MVARYLVAAGLAEEPEQGYEYAQAARRLAARVGVVREATGIAAYETGRWAEALAELRAARRLTGGADYLPMMADSERALGRLDRALALIREADASTLDRATQIELRIVESGIRRDQGLADAAVIVLQVPELTSGQRRPWSARLFYAYGDALLEAGRPEEARDAFVRATAADPRGETDAADRLDELDGFVFEDLAEDDDVDEDEALEGSENRTGEAEASGELTNDDDEDEESVDALYDEDEDDEGAGDGAVDDALDGDEGDADDGEDENGVDGQALDDEGDDDALAEDKAEDEDSVEEVRDLTDEAPDQDLADEASPDATETR
jgi:tetratricopeptide (TPR) repeat protein